MIHLEKISHDTIHLMRKWRNHDHMSFRDRNLITHNQQEEWYIKYLSDLNYWYFIVYFGNVPIGSIGLSRIDTDEAHIESLILGDKSYSRRGLMSDALEQMMTIFPFKKYSLKVLKNNLVAIEFYKKNGFAVASEIESCYIMIK